MANIRRTSRRNIVGEVEHRAALSAAFDSNWFVQKYRTAVALAEDAGDHASMRTLLRDLGDRIYGKPAQVVVNETEGVRDVLEAFHAQMIENGLGEVIVLDVPRHEVAQPKKAQSTPVAIEEKAGSNDVGVDGDDEVGGGELRAGDGGEEDPPQTGELSVPADLLGSERLHADSGAEGVP